MFKPAKIVLLTAATAAIILSVSLACRSSGQPYAPETNSVMITNLDKNHGGSGVIMFSSASESTVLTNAHVCGVVENGGLVSSSKGDFQVSAYKKSERSDLCLLTVAADLGIQTKLANSAPGMYEAATISGFPSLYPNIITRGHFSGRRTISVMMGFKKCTEEDMKGTSGILCLFFGGIPQVRNFESQMVSATIMPGSSGSPVYNSQNELSNLVFAGSGALGYAWTVPFEQILNFLARESWQLPPVLPNPNVTPSSGDQGPKVNTKSFASKCDKLRSAIDDLDGASIPSERKAEVERILEVCDSVGRDALWTN